MVQLRTYKQVRLTVIPMSLCLCLIVFFINLFLISITQNVFFCLLHLKMSKLHIDLLSALYKIVIISAKQLYLPIENNYYCYFSLEKTKYHVILYYSSSLRIHSGILFKDTLSIFFVFFFL